MFAYCCEWSMRAMADMLDLVDCVHLWRVKLFRSSRILVYGWLNCHVASIVSMFSKGMFGKKICTCGVLKQMNLYLRGMDWWKSRKLFYKKFCKEKYSFLSMKFRKEKKIFYSLKEVLQRKIFFPQLNIYQNLADTWYLREKLYYFWSIFLTKL